MISEEMPEFPERIKDLISVMGLSTKLRSIPNDKPDGWGKYRLLKSAEGETTLVPIFFFTHKTKPVDDAKRQVTNIPYCVVLFHLKSSYRLFIKCSSKSLMFGLDSIEACEQAGTALDSAGFATATQQTMVLIAMRNAIENIPTTTEIFNNRGVFSTHYLKNRLFDNNTTNLDNIEGLWDCDVKKSLELLGWIDMEDSNGAQYSESFPEASIIVVKAGLDFDMQESSESSAPPPSYRAVAELNNTPWVILTDGRTWRLYTSRVSASTTNYFEIIIPKNRKKADALQYLTSMFGALSFVNNDGKADIDIIFDEGKNYVQELEENLAERILKPDGVFVDLVKGVLGYDGTKLYTNGELTRSKETALKIMYRIWFLLYAESRDLLPARDKKYEKISITFLRSSLDDMETNSNKDDCWSAILNLFKNIRNGSVEHNLPQYNGGLFKVDSEIDNITIKNNYAVRTLRGFMERDGDPIDYASLGVRHLGHIYETLLEFEVRQAKKDLILIEDSKGIREIASSIEASHSYKKNELYIVSKTGAISRKSSGSYYTPEEMVTFLVRRGLEPIFLEREKSLIVNIKKYKTNPNYQNRHVCIEHLLDIQVLDPAMGSGHFLVEALNQITKWVTRMLEKYPDHPLLAEIKNDRETVLSKQKSLGITINEEYLTPAILLKRRIMKRCIFGVDINPLAVELARVSLWLDSFAIGVPLTYLSHHIRIGDSTIGGWRSDITESQNQSLDKWVNVTNQLGDVIERVSRSPDLTIEQAHSSEDAYSEYEEMMRPHKTLLDVYCAAKIDESIIPKKARKDIIKYIQRFENDNPNDPDMQYTLKKTQEIRERHHFFHWELEMTDAFTDSRFGFDCIVGNPPWDKVKALDDEFFSRYYPPFRAITTKTKKNAKRNEILKDNKIKSQYSDYLTAFKEKSAFYRIYGMQGDGDKDLWQLVFECMLGLVSDRGMVSVLVPSQILSNTSSADMRKWILDHDILQLYVFENRKKIFSIHSSYRFVLLTIRNTQGGDTFEAGFYLHNLSSINIKKTEVEKFHKISKEMIRSVSPETLQIPEVGGENLAVLLKMSGGLTLENLEDGWSAAFSRGFDKTNDSDLLREGKGGWPVLEGKHIHQFNHTFAKPIFTAPVRLSLQREEKKRVYQKECRKYYHSFRLVFRNIARSTDMRTIIAAIIPPQRFITYSLRMCILTQNGYLEHGNAYNKKIAYLCGVINSTPFDFVARSKLQVNTSTVIKSISIPSNSSCTDKIAELTAKLSVGTDEFEGFAESLRVKNISLMPSKRVHATANLDALVAHSYGLTKNEYTTILESFKFKENSNILESKSVNFNDNVILRQFYGEVRKLALVYYDEITEESTP